MNDLLIVNKHHKVAISERHFYIGRPSALGNPFEINHLTDRDDVIAAYEPWLRRKIREGHPVVVAELDRIASYMLDDTGLPVYLVCYCSPKPCHGDIIKKVILEAINAAKQAN